MKIKTWAEIQSLDHLPNSRIITNVHWLACACPENDPSTLVKHPYSVVLAPVDSNDLFIEFDDLTEATVLDWVKLETGSLYDDALNRAKESVEAIIKPKIISSVMPPWVKPLEEPVAEVESYPTDRAVEGPIAHPDDAIKNDDNVNDN